MERALRDLAALGEGSLTLKELGREIDQFSGGSCICPISSSA